MGVYIYIYIYAYINQDDMIVLKNELNSYKQNYLQ